MLDLLEHGGKQMIHKLYQKAGELHGHYCPGLAIGVRAAAEALAILNVEAGTRVYCIAESSACYQDGIQSVFGATVGNGNLELRERGKTAFNFYERKHGRCVRLAAASWPEDLSKEEMTEYILTAPLDKVFHRTEVRFPLPERSSKKVASMLCPVCGENCKETYIRIVNGRAVCLDCAEAQWAGMSE